MEETELDIATFKASLRPILAALIGAHDASSERLREIIRQALMADESTAEERADAKALIAIVHSIDGAVELLASACGVDLKIVPVPPPRECH